MPIMKPQNRPRRAPLRGKNKEKGKNYPYGVNKVAPSSQRNSYQQNNKSTMAYKNKKGRKCITPEDTERPIKRKNKKNSKNKKYKSN